MDAILVDGLVKRYGAVTAVDGISFSVRQGEVFGLLGPNGAGKSTTMGVLATLVRPTAGRVLVAGFDVQREQDRVRQAIGIVFQEPSLDTELTARENLDFHAVLYDVPPDLAREREEALLRMLDLWDRRDALVKTFSGGMKRRLEIARGLLHHPRILFLDEPTLGLDPQTRWYIWRYILDLHRREGLTLFLTTHYLDEAEQCDRIAVVDRGRVVALDTPENLKALVGGDEVLLRTEDNERAAAALRERLGVVGTTRQGVLRVTVPRAEECIPRLLEAVPVRVIAVTFRRPTLDDAFLKLTGRALREEEASAAEAMRWRARSR